MLHFDIVTCSYKLVQPSVTRVCVVFYRNQALLIIVEPDMVVMNKCARNQLLYFDLFMFYPALEMKERETVGH